MQAPLVEAILPPWCPNLTGFKHHYSIYLLPLRLRLKIAHFIEDFESVYQFFYRFSGKINFLALLGGGQIRLITLPFYRYIIPQYFSFVKYFIRLFWNYFYFLVFILCYGEPFGSAAPKEFPASQNSARLALRAFRGVTLFLFLCSLCCAALWFSRLRRLQPCFKQKGILYLRE